MECFLSIECKNVHQHSKYVPVQRQSDIVVLLPQHGIQRSKEQTDVRWNGVREYPPLSPSPPTPSCHLFHAGCGVVLFLLSKAANTERRVHVLLKHLYHRIAGSGCDLPSVWCCHASTN
ncbi:unnamed protein product, partial [Sphacelaria rigidula]